MKKTVSLLLALCFILSVFTACGTGGTGNSTTEAAASPALDTSKDVTLTIVGGLENFEGLEAVITKFEKLYSNCTVNYEMLDAYADNVPSRLKNESSTTNLFLSSRSDFTEDGKLSGTAYNFKNGEAKIDLSGTNSTITSSQEVNGELYTIPLAMAPRGIVINKTLLAKHNIAIPTNYEEFLAACKTFKDAGITPIQAQLSYIGMGLVYPYLAGTIVHNDNYKKIFAELNDFTEGSGKYIEDICKRLDTINESGYIEYERNKDFLDNYDGAILNFFEGDVPFFPCTAETVSGMKKREAKSESFAAAPFEYEFICTPIADDGAYCYWQIWQGISVNKDCDNLDWALAFANFLVKEENLNLLAETKGMPANTPNGTGDARYSSLYSVDSSRVVQAADFQISFYSPLNKTLQSIVKPESDSEHKNAEEAVKLFEELIAEKRNEAK